MKRRFQGEFLSDLQRKGRIGSYCAEDSQYISWLEVMLAKARKSSGNLLPGTLDTRSRFYLNCRHRRRESALICEECPFRRWIEGMERVDGTKPRMRCQKGKRCPKQPGNALPILSGDKLCTGCDHVGKDRRDKHVKDT